MKGASAGSGWNIPFVPIAKGLCLNERNGAHGQELSDETLSGVVWSAYGTATLQFDYAAISPGEWNHVIFMLSNTMRYKAYTGADSGEAWLFKADAGTNMNGWTYSGNFFAGYQLPFHSTLIGGFAQDDQTLVSFDHDHEAILTLRPGNPSAIFFLRARDAQPFRSVARNGSPI